LADAVAPVRLQVRPDNPAGSTVLEPDPEPTVALAEKPHPSAPVALGSSRVARAGPGVDGDLLVVQEPSWIRLPRGALGGGATVETRSASVVLT